MDETLLVYTTWPDADTAATVGRAAVEARLAACVNILAPMRSIYRWEGAVEEAGEVPALFKTTAAAAEALRAFVLARHPYDLPCVVALAVEAAHSHAAYLAWVAGEASPPPPDGGGPR